MSKNKNLVTILIISLCLFLASCGIQPPTQDLEKAKLALAQAEEVNAQQYAPEEYNEAKSKIAQGEKTIVPKKSSKNKDAKSAINSAEQKAKEAFQKAAPKFAEDNINSTKESLTTAQNNKVNIALKDEYQKAEGLLKEAETSYSNKDFVTAGKKSQEAKKILEEAIKITDEKRIKAESSLNEAKQKIENLKK